MYKFLLLILIGFIFINITSCNESNSASTEGNSTSTASTKPIVAAPKSADDGFEMLHSAFEGYPDVENVKKLVSAIMIRNGIEINYRNIEKVGSALIGCKQRSAVGVTEMDILKHMYQSGDVNNDFVTQAVISADYLEQTK